MIKEYKTISEVVGPLMLVKDVENVTYDELGEILLPTGERRMCRVLGAYNGRDCSRVNIVRMPRDQILRSNIENPVRMPFGGMEVWAPRDVESYLRHHYPNLRPDLPEEEQINHAPYKLSFDTTKEEE